MNDDSSPKTVDVDIEMSASKRKPSNSDYDSSGVPKKKKVTQSSVTETPKGARPSSAFVTPDTENAASVHSNIDDDGDDDDQTLPAVNLNVVAGDVGANNVIDLIDSDDNDDDDRQLPAVNLNDDDDDEDD